MKYFFILLFIILLSCTNKKEVHWCGDHACINNKEKKAYFEKTLITEIKDLTKQKRKKSNFEIIKEKAGLDLEKEKEEEFEDKIKVLSTEEQKALAKQLRLEEKQRIKEEKKLTKQSRLDEKKIGNEAKAEGDCTKLVKLHEKLKCKMDEKKANKAKSKKDDSKIKLEASVINEKDMDSSVEFNELVKKIHKKNLSRSYPDINDIPK
tara:strand:+ start:743 stop:1363 length:621 start_codon:yes stop_codon:yes gene_type:complete